MPVFEKLRRTRYAGILEGLEECLPKFRSASVVLLTGKSHKGGCRRGRRRPSSVKFKKRKPTLQEIAARVPVTR